MKKKYLEPEMDVTEFDANDVITTSGGEANPDDDDESNG